MTIFRSQKTYFIISLKYFGFIGKMKKKAISIWWFVFNSQSNHNENCLLCLATNFLDQNDVKESMNIVSILNNKILLQ